VNISCVTATLTLVEAELVDTMTSTRHHSEEEYLDAIKRGAKTTPEIAEAVGVTRQGAHKRLQKLSDVYSKKIGNTNVWFLID
jgi:predicted HTH transcriptional regulator